MQRLVKIVLESVGPVRHELRRLFVVQKVRLSWSFKELLDSDLEEVSVVLKTKVLVKPFGKNQESACEPFVKFRTGRSISSSEARSSVSP